MQDDSARNSLQTFVGGKGDAMIAYENDAIFAQQNGQSLDYTVPDATILIENPVAVTTNSAHPTEAKAFLDFLLHAGRRSRSTPTTGTGRSCTGVGGRHVPDPGRACSRSTTSVAGPR